LMDEIKVPSDLFSTLISNTFPLKFVPFPSIKASKSTLME